MSLLINGVKLGFTQIGCITSLLIAIQDFLVSGVRFQLIRFLLLTPDCKAFAQKMNKLMGENHFNKSVILPSNIDDQFLHSSTIIT